MRFNTFLPSTHIPGSKSTNMSPQMQPEFEVSKTQSKMSTINKPNSTGKSSYSTYPLPGEGRYSGRKVGGKTTYKRDNKFVSVKPPSMGNYKSKDLSKISSLAPDTGRFGYNSNDSSPISIPSKNLSLFTNPQLPGEFDVTFTDVSLVKLAVNLVDINLLGFTKGTESSIAKDNFDLIYAKMVSRLANNPSKAYQVAFKDIGNVRTYFNSLFKLLSRYYELESILAWNPPREEFNLALHDIRKSFDNTEILFLKIDLVELLQLYYLPDEFVNLANYFNQTYRTGNVSDSKVFKFMSKDLAKAIYDKSNTEYVTKIRSEISNLRNDTDDSANGKLSAYTVAQISGFLDKDFTFGKIYSSGLPGAANHAIHDLDAYDIFINQSTLYSNTVGIQNTKYSFPDYAQKVNTPYATHKEADQISTFQIAFQGVSSSSDSVLTNGFIKEETIDILNVNGQTRSVNKLWLKPNNNGSVDIFTRSAIRTNIFNDFNFVNLDGIFPFDKVSIAPSHTHLVYMNGVPIKDVATRNFSNQIFGNL